MADSQVKMHKIFVYGTLKRKLPNYNRYLSLSESRGGAEFLGEAVTKEKFNLVVRPAGTHPPVMMRGLTPTQKEQAKQITGEVFKVDDYTLHALDLLEGIQSGYYYRDEFQVELLESKAETEVWTCKVYLFPADDKLMQLKHYSSYNAEAQSMYKPRKIRKDIEGLCKGIPHRLSTEKPVEMKVHAIRLLPGDDLVLALRNFCDLRSIKAATVLSCVGSTAQTVLRPAATKTPLTLTDKYEILSFSGTISNSSHHLHLR